MMMILIHVDKLSSHESNSKFKILCYVEKGVFFNTLKKEIDIQSISNTIKEFPLHD